LKSIFKLFFSSFSAAFMRKVKSHFWCGMAKPILRQSLRKIAPPAVD
jgi:hypothetical protein